MSWSVAEDAPAVEMERATHVFLAERTRLLRIARRVVGDAAAAEDVVQEAWIRWQRVDRSQIRNPAAFLTTTTTHLAINVIQSARHRHEITTDTPPAVLGLSHDPSDGVDRTLVLQQGLDFLMARLSPAELTAFLLRKCFDYAYPEIAGVLGTSAANARQLLHRSRIGLGRDRVREVDPETHRRLVSAFALATTEGHVEVLVDLLRANARRSRRCRATEQPGS